MRTEFSDYIIYVDESGDHSLEVIYEEHPVFVLAFCIFKKEEYSTKVVPPVSAFFEIISERFLIIRLDPPCQKKLCCYEEKK